MNSDQIFADLGLAPKVLSAVNALGYEIPTPIQAQAIPVLLSGANLLGTAQTGTGKTAAFALPLLSRLDPKVKLPQVLIMAPTRELAIQVSEAVFSYARGIKNFQVLPIYGGQDIAVQLRALKRRPQVIVGTPGRILDHLRRKSLDLSTLQAVVLDEADEMLKMGFQEDMEEILAAVPDTCQRALFSATMPKAIQKIVHQHIGDAQQIRIQSKTSTVEAVEQKFLLVRNEQKFEALNRILEVEEIEGVIVFVRTKAAAARLSERLEARGFGSAPLSGDINQAERERTVNRLKSGQIDVLVATDVAARGLDVDRISHVVNYDTPYDTESYVHRIGRTGRAGRTGIAILFVTPRERRMVANIEKSTRQKIEQMNLPSGEQISSKRVDKWRENVLETIAKEDLSVFSKLVAELSMSHALDPLEIASALTFLAQKEQPLFPKISDLKLPSPKDHKNMGFGLDKDRSWEDEAPEEGFNRYYLAVGKEHRVGPSDIVGAIANEGQISSRNIGRVRLFRKHSTVELPENMSKGVLQKLAKLTI